MTAILRATVDDLRRSKGKAELIGGKVVELMATGRLPNRIAGRIFRSLAAYVEVTGLGEAFTDNLGFVVPLLLSGRESFNPDASYHLGPFPLNLMRFIDATPTFAVEVRSENDYADSAEAELAAKRADYFLAGTPVVWDVDAVRRIVNRYNLGIAMPTSFRPGDMADAEPAVPLWRLEVAWLFA